MSESIPQAEPKSEGSTPKPAVVADAKHAGNGHAAADEHHGHSEHPFLAHHFDTPQQQFEAGKLGIWLFLLTEVLFFAGLFCAYTVYRAMRPEVFVRTFPPSPAKWQVPCRRPSIPANFVYCPTFQ